MAGRAELDRGRGLRAKSKSLKANQRETITNNDRIIYLKLSVRDFISFLRRKHDFTGKISTFV